MNIQCRHVAAKGWHRLNTDICQLVKSLRGRQQEKSFTREDAVFLSIARHTTVSRAGWISCWPQMILDKHSIIVDKIVRI